LQKKAEVAIVITNTKTTDRESVVLGGSHVTKDTGTGIVHTAPAHGLEDFAVCQSNPSIPLVSAVNEEGKFTSEAGSIFFLLHYPATSIH